MYILGSYLFKKYNKCLFKAEIHMMWGKVLAFETEVSVHNNHMNLCVQVENSQ